MSDVAATKSNTEHSDRDNSEAEVQHLLDTPIEDPEDDDRKDKTVMPSTKSVDEEGGSLLRRLMRSIEERRSTKLLMKVWGPRLELVIRLMLVATFLDDSHRISTRFSDHAAKIVDRGILHWLSASSSRAAVNVLATAMLGAGLLAQSLGSCCLIARRYPDEATKALIAWVVAQPILYAQLSNLEFLAESMTLLGGLLTLRARLIDGEETSRFLGRLLLPATFLYGAGAFLMRASTLDETNGLGSYLASLSAFVLEIIAWIGLGIGSALVAAGLRSRVVAASFALSTLAYSFYAHPFFLFLSRRDGEWGYDEARMDAFAVSLPEGLDASEINDKVAYDLHKYYFYLGLSASGALSLLAMFGPGETALQKDETLLPTVRAKD